MSEITPDELARRLQAVEDELAVRNVITRYCLAVDCGHAEAAMAQFTEDGLYTVASPGSGREDAAAHTEAELVMRGRQAVGDMVMGEGHQALLPNCAHTVGPLEVSVNGDTATAMGYSRLYIAEGETVRLMRLGINNWRLRREEGRWRISRRTSTTVGTEQAQALLREGIADWDLT